MTEHEKLKRGFVTFLDGLWWGLRDNVGPLSMYEAYAKGFRNIGVEAAEAAGARGAEEAACVAAEMFSVIGLDVELDGSDIYIKSCPLWNRVLEHGLEYSFHIEEICWLPMLEGIGEIAKARPSMKSALRLIHLEKAKAEYKKGKIKSALEKGSVTKDEYEAQITSIEKSLEGTPSNGHYRFD